MYTASEITKSIAFCGLICRLCFLADKCDGCKIGNNKCERNCSDEGCFNKKCCNEKQIEGCWECDDIYKCEKGIFNLGNKSKIKAFSICIMEDGIDFFADRILKNMKKGLSVEKGKDYDDKTIIEVLKMIRR